MDNSNKENKLQTSDIDSKKIVVIICFIVLIIFGFYFYNFHNGLSKDNGVWGTFGDYVGGILNPIIAAFAFYLIAKTYELQKIELEEIRISQNNQIKLAALTALLNSTLMKIDMLNSEKINILDIVDTRHLSAGNNKAEQDNANAKINGLLIASEEISKKISEHNKEIAKLEDQIKSIINS